MTGQRPGADTPLSGRRRTLDLIEDLLRRRGATLVLVGDPGTGKTAILDAAARGATDAVVLRAEGVEFEADLSFSGLHQALLPMADGIAALDPAHRTALSVALGLEDGPAPARPVLHEAVLALLRRAARAGPVLILIDDLHWVDRSTVSVLRHVGRHLDRMPVVLVATVRPGHAGLVAHPGSIEHTLDPLDDHAATDLLATRFPALGADDRERLLAEAQGNPLALVELAASTVGVVRAPAHRAGPTPDRRVRALFAERVEALARTTRRFLLLAALESSGDLDVLLGPVPGPDEHRVLGAAEASGLLRVDHRTRTVRFHHPIARATVVDLASGGDLECAHRTLADRLADRPGRQAWHLAGAARGPDERVARALEHAALDSLRRGDSVGSVATLMRAVELSPHGRTRARRLAEAAHLGADVTGGLRDVTRLLRAARATDSDVTTSLRGVVAAAHLLLHGDGEVDTAFRLLIEAVESEIETRAGAEVVVDDSLVEALFTLLWICNSACRPESWARCHAALARLRPHLPDLLELCAWSMGDAARTPPAVVDQVVALVDGLRDEGDPRRILYVALAAFYVERLEGCRDALWRVARDGQAGGATATAMSALTTLAHEAYHTGRWDEAGELAARAVALCDSHGYALDAAPAQQILGLLAAARGEDDTVRALTDEMVNWGVPHGFRKVVVYAGWVRALAALGRGDFEDAYREAAAVSPPGELEFGNGHLLWLTMDLVDAATRTHRHAEAAAHVAVMHEVGIARLAPRLALLAAGSAAIAAPDDRAGDLFEAALALPDLERWPFDLARVRLAYGEHLRRARATTAARGQLSRALDTFVDLGARPWVARATTELRAAGHDPGRGSGERAHAGQAALTAQELEVAGLAASGMTNRQIADRLHLSRRTVDAHLYRVFPKLNITGRAALRDALDGRGA